MGRTLFLLLLLTSVLGAVQDGEPAAPVLDPAHAARDAAQVALSEGRLLDANRHLRRALEVAPFDPDLILLVLGTLEGDEDARLLWSHAWYDAVADAQGRARPGPAARALASSTHPAAIAAARAAAVGELVAFAAEHQKSARRKPDELLVADWARRLALELAGRSPALTRAWNKQLAPILTVPVGFHDPLLKALERVLNSALSGGDTGLAMRAARNLSGLAVQGSFKDLKGPRPRGMDSLRAKAAKGLARAREQLLRDVGQPWTVEQLEWLDSDEGEAFTRGHRSFAMPGVAVSPRGWYRVETDCGFETLLGVAETIEAHHERLAGWYGTDPFVDRPGTVRVVPEANGLESEGAPFWWAGGFQGGDTTVMRFAQGNIEGLGHGLTHELTHRFDGAVYPGQPAWLTEGKAVWTGSAYGHSSDAEFVPNHVSFGTIEGVFVKGWGGLAKLSELIEGKLEDYRDNYSVGYSLYVYLNTWEVDGRRLFQERLQRFMEEGRRTKLDARAFFEACFCDGKQGRPEDLEAFIPGWAEFLRGFYWKSRAEWTSRYTGKVPPAGKQPWVYDEPTWTWQRHRSEPWFGQDQARVAGRLLLDAGKDADAVRALIWSVAVDGREPRSLRWLAEVLPGLKRAGSAWVAASELRFPLWPARQPAPFVPKRLPRTRALLAALEAAATDYTGRGQVLAGAALAADHDRLARWLGAPEMGPRVESAASLRHPFDRGARPLGDAGWREDELVGYDKERVAGLWYAAPSGDLYVGRRKPRSGTGRFDRGGGGVAFTRSEVYLLPGTYRLRTRVQFTTSHASGVVVIGYQRRDLGLRFGISGGDYMYAVGENEEEPEFKSMGWSLSGMWERDGALGGSTRGGQVAFERPSTTFELELLVDGASVQAFVNGRRVGTYHTADGRPIEGHIGFATGRGALRFQRPTVQRLDRARLARLGTLEPEGLDLARGTSPSFANLENRPIHGLEPSTNGTLLLWVGMPWQDPDKPGAAFDVESVARRAGSAARSLARAARKDGLTQPIVLALPAAFGDLRDLEQSLLDEFDGDARVRVLPHGFDGRPNAAGSESPDLNKRWLMFVDAAGVVRVCQPYVSLGSGFEGRLGHWLTVFREHGQPARELPAVERHTERDDE
jgi:hypothetical protein